MEKKICYHFITYELGVIYKTHRVVRHVIFQNKRQRKRKGQSKRDKPENLATYGTQDEEKQNKTKT